MFKVAFDHQIFASQQYGGVSRYYVELARRIAATPGCSARVIAPLHFNDLLRTSGLRVLGFYTRPTQRTTGRYLRALNRLVTLPYLWASAPQILHQTYYPNVPYRLRGTTVVTTVYDMIHERCAGMFNSKDDTTRRKRATVEHSDVVICISEHTRRDLIELFGVPEARTRMVHFGFSPLAVQPRAPAPPVGRFLLFVGDRGGYKNFSGLLKAYAASPRLRNELAVVACGRHAFYSSELALMRRLGLDAQCVKYVPGGDDVLAMLYTHAAALVYPSLYEGFGLPPLEAMSCDCPVVSSAASCIPEVVGDAAVLVDPNDPEALRDAMERVVFSSELRAGLVARGRERVKRFSWERCAAETLAVYREASGG